MRVFIILSLLITLAFSSCQKEVSIDLRGNGTNGTANDSVALLKFAILDTTSVPGLDTIEIAYFEYDILGRISKIKDYQRDAGSPSPAYTSYSVLDYFYTGNDTLPFKTLLTTDDAPFLEYETNYYYYNQGFVTHDSMLLTGTDPAYPEAKTISYYTVAGNTVSVNEKNYEVSIPGQPPALCELNYTYMLGYVNGNITAEAVTTTGCYTTSWTEQFVFDNKPNPFYGISIPYRVVEAYTGYYFHSQKNNLLERSSGFLNEHVKNFYTYRSDGYPLIVRSQDLTNPSNSNKGLFFYKN